MTSMRRALRYQMLWIVPTIVGTIGMGRLPLAQRLTVQFVMWFSWSIPTLAVFAVGNRWPVSRATAVASVLRFAALGAASVMYLVFVAVSVWTSFGIMSRPLWDSFVLNLRTQGDVYIVMYGGVVGAYSALRLVDRWREETVRSARLGEDLVRAQLHALRAQVNPHFLFNTLASIMSLIGREPKAAERTVVALADLLRKTLALAEHQEISLRDELDLVRRYLDIEQTRFSDRLRVHWVIEDRVLDCPVPALTLQPIVENALVHGIARVTDDGVVEVAAQLDGDRVRLTVRDNGPGPKCASKSNGLGIGLPNLKQRLARLYGDRASLVIEEVREGGCLVTVSLPAAGGRLRTTVGQ